MNKINPIEAAERFFFDIIGAVIPGWALIIGIQLVVKDQDIYDYTSIPMLSSDFSWIIFTVSGYVLGHAINSFGKRVVLPIVFFIKKSVLFSWMFPFFVSEDVLMKKISESSPFKSLTSFVSKSKNKIELSKDRKLKVHDLRNIALSIIEEEKHTVIRFMFLSLLNFGIATVLLLLSSIWIILKIIYIFGIYTPTTIADGRIIFLFPIISLLFWDKYYEFYFRAMKIPFSMAIAKLQLRDK